MKKLLAVLLAATLILIPLSTLLCASAKAAESVPNIFVHGMFASTLYKNPADPDSEVVWPLNAKRIMSGIRGNLPGYIKGLRSDDTNVMIETVAEIVYSLMGDVMLNNEGEIENTSGVRFEYPAPDSVTADSRLAFTYDWRLDPVYLASQLNDFIEYVLECSGCEQVTIQCHSFGSIVTTTYFTLYGHDRVKTVVYNAPALYGETYTGELMLGKMKFDADAIQNYLEFAFDYNKNRDLFNWLIGLLNKYNVLGSVTSRINDAVERGDKEFYRQAVLPVFAMWPSIWAMIPDAMIADADEYIFEDVYGGDTQFDTLHAKIDYFNEFVRAKRESTLLEVNDDTNLYVISKYGYSSMPVSPSSSNLGDGVVDVKYSSFGATAGQYGIPLSASDTENTPEEYLEPMHYIDASTCLFPEQTFFIRDMRHGGFNAPLVEMVNTLLDYDGQATVDTFPQYPRFMYYNGVTDTLGSTQQSFVSFFGKLLTLYRRILSFFRTLPTHPTNPTIPTVNC